MRYPQNADVMLIIRHALYMKSPEIYQCPPNAFVYVVNSMKQRHKLKQSPSRPIPHTKIFPASALAASAVANAANYRARTVSQQQKTSEDIRQETAKQTVQQVKKTHSTDDGIVDGYLLDDPEVLKMELQDSYNIMAVSRLKLFQYVNILRKYIPGNQVDELHQTLDGIEELCSLLKPKHQYLFNVAAPVDPAFEAADEDTLEVGAMALSPPRSFPLSVKKPNEQTEAYEVPNNRVSKNASQMLQRNRREVEMNVIRQSDIGCLDLSQYPQNDPVGERRSSEWCSSSKELEIMLRMKQFEVLLVIIAYSLWNYDEVAHVMKVFIVNCVIDHFYMKTVENNKEKVQNVQSRVIFLIRVFL